MTTEEIFQKYAHTNPPMTVRSIIEYAYEKGFTAGWAKATIEACKEIEKNYTPNKI